MTSTGVLPFVPNFRSSQLRPFGVPNSLGRFKSGGPWTYVKDWGPSRESETHETWSDIVFETREERDPTPTASQLVRRYSGGRVANMDVEVTPDLLLSR